MGLADPGANGSELVSLNQRRKRPSLREGNGPWKQEPSLAQGRRRGVWTHPS